MICPHCQQTVPDDSRFCPFCGKAIAAQPVEKPVKARKPKKEKSHISKKKIILFSVLGVVVALLGVYFGTYFAARSKAQAGDFTSAEQLLLVPAVTHLHDPRLEPFVQAGLLFEQGEYEKAEKAFESLAEDNYLNATEMRKYSTYYAGLEKINSVYISGYQDIVTLAKEGFPIAVETLPEVKEQVYKRGIELYRKEPSLAKYYFQAINPYLRSADYLTLISCNEYGSGDHYKDVVKLIGFENAKEILLDTYAEKFLTGKWKTSDGRYSFTMTEHSDGTHTTNYTLPYLDMSNAYFDIKDGIYFLYKKDTDYLKLLIGDYERKNVFHFSIVTADMITVYCYKDGSTHTLYRQ